jgi:hypothetical protein
MAQAVSHLPFTAKSRVCARVSHVGFVIYKVTLGQVFSVFPVNIITPWLSILKYYLGDEQ